MNQGDALAVTASAIMAAILASRALRAKRPSFKVKLGMALVWLAIIVAAAAVAATWRT